MNSLEVFGDTLIGTESENAAKQCLSPATELEVNKTGYKVESIKFLLFARQNLVKATGEEDILETTIQRLSWFAIGYNHFILIDGVLCLSIQILIVE